MNNATIKEAKSQDLTKKDGLKYTRVANNNPSTHYAPEVMTPNDKKNLSAEELVTIALKAFAASSAKSQKVAFTKKKKTKASSPTVVSADKDSTPALVWSQCLLNGEMGKWAASGAENSLVYKWNDCFWELISQSKGRSIVTKWLSENFQGSAKTSVVKDAWEFGEMTLMGECPLPKRPFSKDIIIPVQNAYIRVASGTGDITVSAPDPTFGLTYAVQTTVLTPHGQSHTAKSVPSDSMFGKFLNSSLPDPNIQALVQEQCALTFIPGAQHMAAWWVGQGRNGKGMMTKLLSLFHSRVAVLNLHKLDNDFYLENLVGASLLLVQEVGKGKWSEETFKSLCAGDSYCITRKHKSALPDYMNEGKFIICSNDPPFVQDTTLGVHERLCAVNWDCVIPVEDRIAQLDQIIFNEEGHIVLDWLLEGVQRIAKRGRFIPIEQRPQSVQNLRADVRFDNDCVGAWIVGDGIHYNAKCKHSKEEVYIQYEEWCHSEARKVLDPHVFWRLLWAKPEFSKAKPPLDGRGPTCMYQGVQKRAIHIALSQKEHESTELPDFLRDE